MASKIDVNFEKGFFKKLFVSLKKNHVFFEIQQVQVGSKNGPKIDQKMGSTREGILASIFHRFWSIWGGKLARKIDQKSIQKGIGGLCSPSWSHLGASWRVPGPSWPHRPPLAGGGSSATQRPPGAIRRDAAASWPILSHLC